VGLLAGYQGNIAYNTNPTDEPYNIADVIYIPTVLLMHEVKYLGIVNSNWNHSWL